MNTGSEGSILAKADEKFLFHMHNFDDADSGAAHRNSKPSVFSEAELEIATKEAYAKGRAEALEESQASREQHMAALLEKIAMQTQALFAQEDAREKTYEREAVSLTLAVFQKLFPVYQEKYGFNELQDQLMGILKSQEGQKSIHIRVAPSDAEEIGSFMSGLKDKNKDLAFKVTGDESLQAGTVHVGWDDGGAVRDVNALAKQVQDRIQEILAARQPTSHDGKSKAYEPETVERITDNMAEAPDEALSDDTIKEPDDE